MNASGQAVRAALEATSLSPAELILIYDDIALPFGRLRLRRRGSSGGHRGVESVVAALGTDRFARLRIGVGHPGPADPVEYVLSPFSATEKERLPPLLEAAGRALRFAAAKGIAALAGAGVERFRCDET